MSQRSAKRRQARSQEKQRAKARKSRQSKTLTVATIIVVVLVIGAAWYFQGAAQSNQDSQAALLELVDQPILGSPDAPVTIVEFGDYKCPHCATFHRAVLPLIMEEYIETGIARYSFIHFPFLGPDSTTAARAARAVFAQSNDAFWTFHDAIFSAQGDERTQWATEEFLLNLARQVVPDLDHDRLAADMRDSSIAQAVQRDVALARSLGVNATPTVFVNGVKTDSPNFDSIRRAVEQALSQLEDADANGSS